MPKVKPVNLHYGYWRLRNGMIVKIDATRSHSYCDGRTGLSSTIVFFIGTDEAGNKCSWHKDGSYSPTRRHHEFDIVSRAKAYAGIHFAPS